MKNNVAIEEKQGTNREPKAEIELKIDERTAGGDTSLDDSVATHRNRIESLRNSKHEPDSNTDVVSTARAVSQQQKQSTPNKQIIDDFESNVGKIAHGNKIGSPNQLSYKIVFDTLCCYYQALLLTKSTSNDQMDLAGGKDEINERLNRALSLLNEILENHELSNYLARRISSEIPLLTYMSGLLRACKMLKQAVKRRLVLLFGEDLAADGDHYLNPFDVKHIRIEVKQGTENKSEESLTSEITAEHLSKINDINNIIGGIGRTFTYDASTKTGFLFGGAIIPPPPRYVPFEGGRAAAYDFAHIRQRVKHKNRPIVRNDLYLVNLNDNTIEQVLGVGNKLQPRSHHSAVMIGNYLVLVGGYCGDMASHLTNILLFFHLETKNKPELFGDSVGAYRYEMVKKISS